MNVIDRARAEVGKVDAVLKDMADEIERLRGALIECGQAAGCLLAQEVSTDFLMGVPAEVRAKMSVCEGKDDANP